MSAEKPLVLVLGASGETGSQIVNSLLNSGKFRVAAAARSLNKPKMQDFKARGADLHALDVASADDETIKNVLSGVDILICTLYAALVPAQNRIFDIAKQVGVKRVVPDEFATQAPPGVMHLHDTKLAVREHIRALGLPHTFVQAGYWYSLLLPCSKDFVGNEFFTRLSHDFIGSGDVPTAGVDLPAIGEYVSRIIDDERTLNQTVFIVQDEVTQRQIWEVGKEKSKDGEALEELRVNGSKEENDRRVAESRALVAADPTQLPVFWIAEYRHSMYIRGDNTVQNAKDSGVLDARELYPDGPKKSLREYAEEFYTNPVLPFSG